MTNSAPFESEVAFLSGVDDTGRAAPISYFTYTPGNPPIYKPVSTAIKWGDATPGTPGGTVTYSFDAAAHWSNTEKMVWEGAFSFWSGLADITFVPADNTNAPDVILERSTDGRARTVFNFGAAVPIGSDEIRYGRHESGAFISIDTRSDHYGPITTDADAKGGLAWSTLLHEVGHMVGLGHGGPYNFTVDGRQQFSAYDTQLWSIMSYFDPDTVGTAHYDQYPVHTGWGTTASGDLHDPLSPQMLDILAVQRLYGASTNATFAGNQTFGFNSTFTGYLKNIYDFDAGYNPDAIVTLWSHGTNNTLDLSGFSQNAAIDLMPGSFSSAGGKVNNIGIAFGTVIDTVKGGSGNDTIKAWAPGTTMAGGAGANTFQLIAGQSSGDTITDFSGRGGKGDTLQFFDYGSAAAGATFTRVDATHWKVTSADGATSETITFANGAAIDPRDVSFLPAGAAPASTPLAHAAFTDFGTWHGDGTGPSGGVPVTGPVTLNVALVLDRANDPTALLSESWGQRQKDLAALTANGALWSTYGADQAKYDAALYALDRLGIKTIDQTDAGSSYVSSAASRTIWVQVTQENFSTLFGPNAVLMADQADGSGAWHWTGTLSLPSTLADKGVSGLWFDTAKFDGAGVANSNGYAAWQSAFWDTGHDQGIVSSSLAPTANPTPGSPFATAMDQLFVDAALHNVSVFGATADSGSGAAAQSWATLAAQINTIFHDQGLPQLGYMNDLLQIASAVDAAAFDSGAGSDGTPFTTGGFGQSGFGQVSHLGTPDGTLLARTLVDIAHHQTSYADSPDLLDPASGGGWQSGQVGQSFLIQATTAANTAVHVALGPQGLDFVNGASDQSAWTARLAQQVLQPDFDANQVRLLDNAGQGSLLQHDVAAGTDVSVAIGGGAGQAGQAGVTSDYGFADFTTAGGMVHLARAVAVAETAGAASDQDAVVRIRQNGQDNLSVSFYRVDDYAGKIGTLDPGDAGYTAAATARMYATPQGATAVNGPGYGLYTQTALTHVNSGDLIAMQLTNQSTGSAFWAFSQANEKVGGAGVGHLWNYGANTWGWEDAQGGGDHDFNDMVVQLDFTSAHGNGWLM